MEVGEQDPRAREEEQRSKRLGLGCPKGWREWHEGPVLSPHYHLSSSPDPRPLPCLLPSLSTSALKPCSPSRPGAAAWPSLLRPYPRQVPSQTSPFPSPSCCVLRVQRSLLHVSPQSQQVNFSEPRLSSAEWGSLPPPKDPLGSTTENEV